MKNVLARLTLAAAFTLMPATGWQIHAQARTLKVRQPRVDARAPRCPAASVISSPNGIGSHGTPSCTLAPIARGMNVADSGFVFEGDGTRIVHQMISMDTGRAMMVGVFPPRAGLPRVRWTRLGLDLIAAVLAACCTAMAGRRWFRRPIARLLDRAGQRGRGDTGARTASRPDQSEFGRLEEAFDKMAAAHRSRQHVVRNVLGVPAAVAMFDTEMRYIAVSERFVRDYDIQDDVAQTMIGRSHYEVFPDIPDKWRENNRRVLAGETLSAEEDSFPRADGRTHWVHWEMAPWRNTDGTIGGLVLYCEIVTERREAQLALRRLTEGLEARIEQEVAAREAALARAAHAERLQALGRLAAGIAHDFNNVLQTIGGAAALIDRRAGDAGAARRLARQVLDATARGAGVTGRLLAFGRHDELLPTTFDIAGLLSGLGDLFVHTLGARIDLAVRVEDPHLWVTADRSHLETVLVNLAANARDAMPDGGRLTVSAAADIFAFDNPLQPARPAARCCIRIDVADTGTGMDPATLARACEPFFSTKGLGMGTGLGLSMAKGFAEQSGGALRIDTSPGNGCVVSLWLPAVAASAAAAGPVCPPEPDRPSRTPAGLVEVLLVDDDDEMRAVISEGLEEAGYSVIAFPDGTEALEHLEAGHAVDVLVTDLSMPGMDGLAVVRAVQQRWPRLPTVMLTGYATNVATLASMGISTASFVLLHKPARIDYLAGRIDCLLAEHERVF